MEDDKNNQEMAKFQQEFRADVQQSLNAAEELAVNQKRTKNKIIVIIAIAVTLIIAAVMIGMIIVRRGRGESVPVEQSQGEEEVAMAFDAETSMIGVLVAPSSAKIMIGGSQYKNGKYEISPGKYEVLIEKEGFVPYSGEITVEDK
ncbi:PEGA domain-containing protein, partial [Candidatus Saccharibacteria bacterium]|nr:PEGA domain-containing protein [Candidatus Saccharibacteria bacterium]